VVELNVKTQQTPNLKEDKIQNSPTWVAEKNTYFNSMLTLRHSYPWMIHLLKSTHCEKKVINIPNCNGLNQGHIGSPIKFPVWGPIKNFLIDVQVNFQTPMQCVIDRKIIGVVSTETEIWFFEKRCPKFQISNFKFQN
jgi:hypothetical protein